MRAVRKSMTSYEIDVQGWSALPDRTVSRNPLWRPCCKRKSRHRTIRRSRLGYMLTDLLVVVACSLAFVAIAGPARHRAFQGPRAATSLNVPVERLDTVMEKYRQDRLRPQ